MSFLDAILNLAALLLWLNWRAVGLVSTPRPGKSFAALLQPTRKPPGTPRFILWMTLLLLARALFYWQIGAQLGWHPRLGFGIVPLTFRSNVLGLMLLYSLFSFARTLVIFYLWMLLISFLNRRVNDSEPCHRWVRIQLGPLERLPAALRLALPLILIGGLWAALNPFFQFLRLVPVPHPGVSVTALLVEQGIVVGFSAVLAWKFLLIGLLLLHLLNSYVHLGAHPFWNFVTLTSQNFLRAFAWLPLRAGRADFAPVIAIAWVWLLAALLAGEPWLRLSRASLPYLFSDAPAVTPPLVNS